MKKVLILALVLGLSGCTALQDAITGVKNPVTPTMLYDAENGATLVFAGLNAWKKSCIAGALPPSCKNQIAQVQIYTRQVPAYLAQLRTFVKNNDQINAPIVYNSLVNLLNTAKTQAAAAGIAIGGN